MNKCDTNEEYQKKLKEYYFKCFLYEFSKMVIFLAIFLFLKLTKEYLAALFFLMLLRKNGGGLHYAHYISCLIVSFLFLFGAIILAIYINPTSGFLYITTIAFAWLGYLLVPVTSKNRPPATPEQIKKSKQNTVILITAFCLLIFFLPGNSYMYIGYWTIVLHILQLMVAHIWRR